MTTEFSSPLPLPHIPDDLNIPQFFFSADHPARPVPRGPPNIPWLIEDKSGRSLTRDQAKDRTDSIARGMKHQWNLTEDDIVLLFSPNHIDYPIVIWATHTLGAIVSPANPTFTTEELVYQLQATKAVLILAFADFLDTAIAAAKAVGLPADRIGVLEGSKSIPPSFTSIHDLVKIGGSLHERLGRALRAGEAKQKLAFLSFSSGTTGKPKAVAIPHYSVIANVIQTAVHCRINDPNNKDLIPGGVAAAVLPMFHIYGLILHFMVFAEMSVLVIPKFNFEEYLKSLVQHRATHLFLVPPQVVLLCKHPATSKYDLSHIKFILCGAAPLSGELLLQVSKLLPSARIGQGYGLTETSTTVCMIPHYVKVAPVGSSGALVPGTIARIVKSDGTLGREGERGELVVKGPANALGYHNNAAATAETFVDGWVRTGDEVVIQDGQVYIVDRLKEIMKVRGFQVAPAELEGHLLLHPFVSDVCVIGVPDEYSGELPYAFVVLPSHLQDATKDRTQAETIKKAIFKHVSDSKVEYKWLKGGIEFVEVIPKNPSGKILRRVLRDMMKSRKVLPAKL